MATQVCSICNNTQPSHFTVTGCLQGEATTVSTHPQVLWCHRHSPDQEPPWPSSAPPWSAEMPPCVPVWMPEWQLERQPERVPKEPASATLLPAPPWCEVPQSRPASSHVSGAWWGAVLHLRCGHQCGQVPSRLSGRFYQFAVRAIFQRQHKPSGAVPNFSRAKESTVETTGESDGLRRRIAPRVWHRSGHKQRSTTPLRTVWKRFVADRFVADHQNDALYLFSRPSAVSPYDYCEIPSERPRLKDHPPTLFVQLSAGNSICLFIYLFHTCPQTA